MRTTKSLPRLLCVCFLLAWPLAAAADDASAPVWPGWRGPTGDGITPAVPRTMPTVKLLWSKKMAALSHSGVAADEGCVVVCDHQERKLDIYRCYDAETGKERWTYTVPNTAKIEYGAAPKATPYIYKGNVYLIGATGDLHCVALKTGKAVWTKSFPKDLKSGERPVWGFCMAPIVADGMLLVMPSDVYALKPADGSVIWRGSASGTNYSNLIVGTFGGVRQVVGHDAASLGGWDAKTGKRLWSIEVDNSNGYVVPSPVNVFGKLLMATETEGGLLFAFDAKGKTDGIPSAENEDLCPEMATPTLVGDLLLCTVDGLMCLDAKDKLKECWIQEKEDAFFGLGHIVAHKDRALVFGDNGTMVLIAVDRKKCTILGKAKLCKDTWSHPALAYGKVYIRDEKMLYCYELVGPSAAKPASAPAVEAAVEPAPAPK